MKCEKCGKRIANYHYMSNVNGKVTEQHLCDQCAAELEGKDNVFANAGRMFDQMWNSFWGDGFGRLGMPSFGSFFGAPTLVMPHFQLTMDGPAAAAPAAVTPAAAEPAAAGADPEMSRQRQINMLREQIKTAVENEQYEKAAELRDQIRALEK